MYKKGFKYCVIAVMALGSTIAIAGSLKDAPVAFQSGNWKILRTLDQMTDKVDCTGIYKDDYGTQLTDDSLFLPVKGGIQGVTLRFGELPAEPLRLASDMEKKVGFVVITGSDFSKLLANGKLRFQISTLVNGINSGELDLTGVNEALASIKSGCPITAQSPQSQKPTKPKVLLCNEILIARMKSQGLKEGQIQSICE